LKKAPLVLVLLLLVPFFALAQRGLIIKAATTSVMDPNHDGFVSRSNLGFSFDGYYVDEFEIPMFGLPQSGGGDSAGDNVGPSCGITDLIPDSHGHSVYAVLSGNNLIFRFRVGDDRPSVEAWSVLLDVDGKFGAADPNATTNNPGFEVDITLIKSLNGKINVYNIDGTEDCRTEVLSYDNSSHFQIAIADEVTCGDPDYFYDYYVPLDQLQAAFGITGTTGVRFAAMSNTSATCAMNGRIADVSGVDDNDPLYDGCPECAFAQLVNNQCPVTLGDLCPTCGGFDKNKVNAPTINVPVRAGQGIISGGCDAGIYITVETYARVGGTDAAPIWSPTPRETKSVTAIGTVWSVTLTTALAAYDKIVARAQKDAATPPCSADGDSQASTSVTVVQPNTPPVAQNQNVTVTEDTPRAITLTATDPQNDPLIYIITSPPAHGFLTGILPNIQYTPILNYSGPDSFSFQVSDGIFNSASPGTVTITVTPVNDAPIANNQNVTTPEDVAKLITLSSSDVDGGPPTYAIVTGPLHGTLSGSGASLTYTPAANYNGTDNFTFRANDGLLNSNTATVSIIITPVDDAPVANSQSVTILEEEVKPLVLTGTDVDGDALTFIIVAAPLHGALSGSGANITYTPFLNYFGSDSFTFKASDGTLASNIATVSITITNVNDPPIANSQSVTTAEDVAVPVNLTGSDVDANPLTYAIVAAPLHGVLSGTGSALTYTPAANYNGPDNFTFRVNDGIVNSNVATVSITITSVNDAPTASAQSVTTNEDVPKAITLSGNDIEGSALTYTVVAPPAHGTLTGTAPSLTYTPALNYNGPDNFTFKVNDGSVDSNIATVTITVVPVNDRPVATGQSVNYLYNTPKAVALTGSDVEGDPLTYIIVTGPAHGTLSGSGANITYTPTSGYTGSDSFTFKVNDGTSDSNIATVSLFLDPASNLPPVANSQTRTVVEDTPSPITLTGSDANADPLIFIITGAPTHGTLSGAGANITYTPTLNFNGSDSFTFKVNDGSFDSNIATITITVTAVNDRPVAVGQSVNYLFDTPKPVTLTGTDVEGDPLTYIIVAGPAHGTLSGSGSNITYTPNSGYIGNDTFTFKVNDGNSDSNIATVSLFLDPASNLPPVADSQTRSVVEDTPSPITLTASDPNANPLTFTVTGAPTHGTLSGSGANITYTPNLNYNGSDSFTFKANDGSVDSNIATISITVTAVNDPPVAIGQSDNYLLNTPKPITLAGSDIEGDALTFIILAGPTNGTLTGSAPSVTYTPNSGYVGPDTFTFKVNDGTTDSNIATVSLFLQPGSNVPPTADDQTRSVVEDTPTAITLTASDANADPLIFTITSAPTHGTLSGSGANITYTPTLNYNGPDSYTFKVNDGSVDSNIATVSITVTPVNDRPVALGQSVDYFYNTPQPITLAGTDIEGDALTYIIVAGPAHGSLSGSGSNITYTPNSGYVGSDSFTFKVNDGTTDSNIATVSLFLDPSSNLPPVADNQTRSVVEDTPSPITLTASDANADPLTFSIVTPPTHGALSGSGADLIYTPNLNYNGPDSYTFKVNDGSVDSNIATITITVTAVNDKPIATGQSVNYFLNTPQPITLTASDIEGDPLTYSIVTAPTNGTMSGTGANVTYTPNSGFTGPDSFTFKVNDGTTDSNIATVSLFLDPASNVPPIADNQTRTVIEDTPSPITLTASDANADPLTFSITSAPTHGTLSGVGADLVYTPNSDYNGPDSYSFKVNDGSVDSNIATISVTVTAVNDAPQANAQSISTLEETAQTVTLTGSDVDLDALVFSVVSPPAHGTLSGTAPNLTYTPALNYSGQDQFSFKVNDGTVDSGPALVSINVINVNDLPVVADQNFSTPEDVVLNITETGSDADLDAISFSLLTAPLHGTLAGIAPNFTYTPVLNYNGSDSFTFSAHDGSGSSNIGTITITVVPVNDLPTVESQSLVTAEDVALLVNVTGADVDGDPLTYAIVGQPQHGTLGIAFAGAPTITYTPSLNYNGSDSFTFTANDGTGNSNIGTIAIDITPVDDPPVAFDQSGVAATTPENTPLSITLTGSDPEGSTLTYTVVTPPAHGTLSGSAPNLVFTPAAGYSGPDSFTFKVNDGSQDSNIATVSITVTPIVGAPVANDQSVSLAEDTDASFVLTASDAENDPLTYSLLTQVAHGSLTGILPNLKYTPNSNYNGTDNLTFKVNDGSHDSNIATVTFTVTPVNDAPFIFPLPDLRTPEDSTLQVCINAVDVDGDAITFGLPVNVSGGGSMRNDKKPFDFCYIFTPAKDFNGLSLWTMTVTDATGLTASTPVKIIVTPVNDPPTAVRDVFSAYRHVELTGNVLTNDSDIEGDKLTLTVKPVVDVLHGTLALQADGNFTYTSERSYRGLDSLVYEVCDNGVPSKCSRATAVIEVGDDPVKVYEGVSPNGDGANEYLRIDGIDYYENNSVQIFDRYDNLVFEIGGYDNEDRVWRGQANKGIGNTVLPEGTYFYVIKLGDGSSPLKGFIVLKKQ
jgi:gliding motility-associated-like protein